MKIKLFYKSNLRILFMVCVLCFLPATAVLAAGGTLDSTFGTGGVVNTNYNGTPSSALDVALQTDGKIVVLESIKLDDEQSIKIIARYNSNGVLDATFGVNGNTSIEIENFNASKIALQPDGKLIVGGKNSNQFFAAARYNSNGTLDTSFGTNGWATYDWGYSDIHQSIADMAIQTDGKIVIVGNNTAGQSNYTEVVYVRFNSNGTKDIGNIVDIPNNRFNYGQAVAIQPDGKIVISGVMTDVEGSGTFLSLARLNSDGSLDKTGFGTNGTVVILYRDFENGNSTLALQADGKIIMGGTANGNPSLIRFNTNGSLDTSFGGTGIVATDLGETEDLDDLVIQPDGKILMEGKTSSGFDTSDFLLARYNNDGSLDSSFGTNSKVTTDFAGGIDSAKGIALQTDGKAIVIGSSSQGGILARYETGLVVTPNSLTFGSVPAYDGWILESGENTNKGGTLDKRSNLIYVGDDAKDRQYRGILSFNTDSIPDNAVVTSGQLKIKRQSYVGTIPLKTHGAFQLEIRNGSFNNDIALTLEDFSAPASTGSTQDVFSGIDTNGIHTAALSNTNLGVINKSGVTQFRVSFSKDDNDDMGADYVKLFSGEATPLADTPQLVITYSTAGTPTNQPPVITSNEGGATANISLAENTTSVTTVTATDPDGQTLTYSISGGADAALFTINPSSGTLSFVTAPSYNVPNDAGLDHIYNVTVQVSDGSLTDSQELVISIIPPNPPPPAGAMLDATFGSNGAAATKFNGLTSSIRDIVLQPDSKIVVLGNNQSAKIIARFNNNGSLDNTFGSNGITSIDFPSFSGKALALQPDGKLVVAGQQKGFAAVRYNSNGSLDTSFGANGLAALDSGSTSTDIYYSVEDVAIQPDGKIVMAGNYYIGNHIEIEVVRFNSDGTRDVINPLDWDTFGSQYNYGKAVVLQPDNKIVVSGDMVSCCDTYHYISLARLNPDLNLDRSTFGTKGGVTARLNYFQHSSGALALQPDGRIILAGTIIGTDWETPQNLALARFNTDGSQDTTFGGTGIIITDFGAEESAANLVIQANGKIIVAGTTTNAGASDFLLVRYNSDGSLDTSFGTNGKLTSDFGNSSEAVSGIVQQLDGKVIVSGNSGDNAILARYLTGTTNATGTTTSTSFKSAASYDGWILESGEFSNAGGTLDKLSNVINVGDDEKDRQYRGILSFDTSSIPDNATITAVQVKIKKQGVVGANPFTALGDLLLDIRKGPFSNDITLNLGDFSAFADSGSTPEKFSAADDSWYSASLSGVNLGLINKYGSTQFRLLFAKDDNDNLSADYIKFFSGSATTSQPELFVTYSTSGGAGNQAPVINGGATLSVRTPENTTLVSGVTAIDPDGQPITYSISGADAGLFSITPTGVLSFINPPDFEAIPSGTVYHVTAQASDGSLTATQAISVTVTPINEFAPAMTSSAGTDISLPENTLDVTTITTTDADLSNPPITYLLGGSDWNLFNLDSATGKLSFITAPSYGTPNDSDQDHVYNVNINADDGKFSSWLTITVTIVNPSASPAPAAATALATAIPTATATSTPSEGFTILHQFGSQANNGRVPYGVLVPYNGVFYGTTTYGGPPYNVAPTNPANKGNIFKMNMDGSGFTVLHEFAGGANDGWKPWSGLAIANDKIYGSTVYGGPKGESGGIIYEMGIDGSGFRVLHAFGESGDGYGGSTSPILVDTTLYGLTRWGGNGTGTIYSYNIATGVYKQLYRFAANSSDGNAPLGTLAAANDGYLYGTTWLGGKNNLGTLFRIKPDGSAFETVYNFVGGAQGKYPYDTLVFDGDHTLYGTTLGEYGVDLTDLGVVFKYDINSKSYSVLHKFAGGPNDGGKPNGSVVLSSDGVTLFGTTHGDDAWGGSEYGILYQINTDGTNFKQLYEFKGGANGATPMRTPLLINGNLYGMTAYGGSENYGLIYSYHTASMGTAMAQRSAVMLDIKASSPVITSKGDVSVSENSNAATTITATDEDNQPLTYSITGGADSSLFKINSSTGELTFAATPDFETPKDAGVDNVYNLTVQASDGSLAVTQDVSVTVTAADDNTPAITSGNAFSIAENTTAVTTVTATDADLPTQTLTYSISGGVDAALFNINSSTGELTFISAPDFETPKDAGADNIYNVTVQASDGTLSATQDVSVTVTAVNDNTPAITSNNSASVPENTTAVITVTTKDADLPTQTLTYSITGGADAALFNINSSTGELTFVTAPDFEAPKDAGSDNIYNLTVQASDGTLTVTQDIAVTVTPINDNTPVITSGNAVSIPENTTAVIIVTATDADLPAQTLTYSITGGADGALFNVNSLTGELAFIAAPDFETPKDAGTDNTYNVTIQASDGSLTVTQDIAVTVTAVNDNTPVITSGSSVMILENTTAVTTVAATDADLPVQTLTYSITGGADAALFTINSSTGSLSFVAAHDYEKPNDAGGDNIYDVTVQASDGTLNVTQAITVTILPFNDNNPEITSPNHFSIPENTTAITTLVVTDADRPAEDLTYSIIDGLDKARFSIVSTTGALTFVTAPDFETPTDSNTDNIYEVEVQVSDGDHNVTQKISVQMTDVDGH